MNAAYFPSLCLFFSPYIRFVINEPVLRSLGSTSIQLIRISINLNALSVNV